MAAVPIYVWNGTAWQETGPVIPASPIKYQASAPSSPSTGDIWVDSDGDVTTGSQQFQRFRFVASGGETSISGVDANGATLAYTAGTEIVALNGSTLVRGQDYTATNGTSITGLSPALVANDVVEVFSFMAFNVANTYTQSQVDGLLNDYMGMRLIVPSSVANGTISSSGAVSFTAQSSVSLNGCFSSTYDNYRILIDLSTTSGAGNAITIQWRASGTNATGNDYIFSFTGLQSNSTTYNYAGGGNGSTGVLESGLSGVPAFGVVDVYGPFLAQQTSYVGQFQCVTTGTVNRVAQGGGRHGLGNSYDGFTLAVASGTITGTVRVYGYKN